MITKTYACDCGFEWDHGQSGSHFCSEGYKVKVKTLQSRIAELEERFRLIEDASKSALSDMTGLLANQVHDDEGCYPFDGESAWELDMIISKTRLIFDGLDNTHEKLKP